MAANTYLIDNIDLFGSNGITVIKATGLYDSAKQRISKHVWPDKSGTDVDFDNVYFDEHEITLKCLCLANTKTDLVNQMQTLETAIKSKGLMVLSVRTPFRKAFLVYRENAIIGKYSKAVGGEFAFEFTLKLTIANPNAQTTQIDTPTTNHTYTNTKGTGWLHWGDGIKQFLEQSGDYSHDYPVVGKYDIIMDVDSDAADVDPPFVLPDFDADKNATDVTAILTKPFSLYMQLGQGSLAQNLYYHIIMNGVREIIEVTSGTDLSDVTIEREFLDITSDSYLKIECYINTEYGNKTEVFMYKGASRLINGGVKRFDFANDDGIGYSYMPNEFDLSFNNIPEGDINDILEQFKGTVDNRTTEPLIFDISGGTSAIPTSVNALAAKNTMITNGQNYSDNE